MKRILTLISRESSLQDRQGGSALAVAAAPDQDAGNG
jgi:hypothetical protein